jgi:hypothetical protein
MRREHNLLHNIDGMEEALIMMAGHHRLSRVLQTLAELIESGEIPVTPRPGMDAELEKVHQGVAAAATTCREIEDRRRRNRK